MSWRKYTAIAVVILPALGIAASAESSLTIYNRNFAVVRETVPLDLRPDFIFGAPADFPAAIGVPYIGAAERAHVAAALWSLCSRIRSCHFSFSSRSPAFGVRAWTLRVHALRAARIRIVG
jgi:hypothetical protein